MKCAQSKYVIIVNIGEITLNILKNQIQYAILNTPLQILFTRLFFFILNSSIILIIGEFSLLSS